MGKYDKLKKIIKGLSFDNQCMLESLQNEEKHATLLYGQELALEGMFIAIKSEIFKLDMEGK